MEFDVMIHGEFAYHFKFPFVGIHLCWNSLSIITLAYLEKIPFDVVQERLSTFGGAKRRFVVENKGTQTYIDDYAHHPTAITLTIKAARTKFPNKKLVAIFKPDRYSRINGFMNEFAESLKTADEVILCPFPDNATKEEGIDIDIYDLAKLIEDCKVMEENDENAKILSKEENVVYLFMSSKDIYKWKDKVKNFHNS